MVVSLAIRINIRISGDRATRKTDGSVASRCGPRANCSRLTGCGVRRDRLTDFPLVTKGIKEKEDAISIVLIARFGENFEILATHEAVDVFQAVDLQNQRDADSTVDRSTAPDGIRLACDLDSATRRDDRGTRRYRPY